MVNPGRRKFLKTTVVAATSFALAPLVGCGDSDDDSSEEAFSGANFAVIADPHIYDTNLGTYGTAWQEYLLSDRKLLAESESILAAAVQRILASDAKVEFVLVAGDLTKDGEKQCHELFKSHMDTFIDNGIKVLVVPGNHDINNPHAKAFDSDTPTEIDSVTPDEFEDIYSTMGFGDAIERDDNSLSYIAEPVSGLWVFCLDSCKYDSNYNDGSPETSGAFSDETLSWIIENIQTAKEKNKTIIATMHHGMIEHFTGQSQLTGLGDEYVVDDWETVSETLAAQGLNLVFTGHYHAQDAVKRTMDDDSFIFDVETGSLVTYPIPIRYVSIAEDNSVEISTELVEEIDYDTGEDTFPDYAYDYLVNGLTVQAPYYLINGFGLPTETAAEMTSYIVSAMVAHYSGDESPTTEDLTAIATYMADSDSTVAMVGSVLGSLWTDLAPSDLNFGFSLDDGVVSE